VVLAPKQNAIVCGVVREADGAGGGGGVPEVRGVEVAAITMCRRPRLSIFRIDN